MIPLDEQQGALSTLMHFQGVWRPYQERIFQALNEYLENNQVHIVAAPGSGKTAIGLEIVCRLDKPTLILAPTLTIRDQWISRLTSLFLPAGSAMPDWISTDIDHPELLTVTTYQALHCASNGEALGQEMDDGEDVGDDAPAMPVPAVEFSRRLQALQDMRIGTVVVDEAHHLHASWWKALVSLRGGLTTPTVVALTATPPYDLPSIEWQRYLDFCGPIDIELPIPELVRDGHLCPHQDVVYLNTPSESERKRICAFREQAQLEIDALCADQDFLRVVHEHPWIRAAEKFQEEILSDPSSFASMLIFLQHVDNKVESRLLHILGMLQKRVPALDAAWMECLLNTLLFSQQGVPPEANAVMERIARRLRQHGMIERRKVCLQSNTAILRLLTNSKQKLQSITRIVEAESESLGDKLRLVVLTDYIRRDALPKNTETAEELVTLGVTTIFETLRRACLSQVSMGVLCGSLVIIPGALRERVFALAESMGIELARLQLVPLDYDPTFSEIQLIGKKNTELVQLLTALLHHGDITVLVGTKSLLGEGWDAPCVNSLILATTVGTFMLSNQMRGRAIRSLPLEPNKTANVWHLICIEEDRDDPGPDYAALARRFQSFMGPSADGSRIENGLNRLALGRPPFSQKRIATVNQAMTARAKDRQAMWSQWQQAIIGENKQVREEIGSLPVSLPRGFLLRNTLRLLVLEGIGIGIFVFQQLDMMIFKHYRFSSLGELFRILAYIAIVGVVCMLPSLIKALILFLRHGTIESSMQQVGLAVMHSLVQSESITTRPQVLKVKTRQEGGLVYCYLHGGTSHEAMIFSDAMRELFQPIANPRYLLMRRSRWLVFGQRDYLAVPEVLGTQKKLAEYFIERWRRYIGSAELIYARTPEGRRELLMARKNAMSTSFQPRAERLTSWQ